MNNVIMLLQNEYVVVFSIDFTKAFDRVKHHPLITEAPSA